MLFEADLNEGDKVTVVDIITGELRIRKCTVIKEYRYFILADFGAFRESINKANIVCHAAKVFSGWKGEP